MGQFSPQDTPASKKQRVKRGKATPISQEVLDKIALSQKKYELIVQGLGREPTIVKPGMFGSLWSEH